MSFIWEVRLKIKSLHGQNGLVDKGACHRRKCCVVGIRPTGDLEGRITKYVFIHLGQYMAWASKLLSSITSSFLFSLGPSRTTRFHLTIHYRLISFFNRLSITATFILLCTIVAMTTHLKGDYTHCHYVTLLLSRPTETIFIIGETKITSKWSLSIGIRRNPCQFSLHIAPASV